MMADTNSQLAAEVASHAAGETMPELTVMADHAHIFMFSAITWNRHHIHYSKDAAIDEGHRDVVVQRALLGNYLARMIAHWAGESAELRKLQWKVVSSANPNQRLRCIGEVLEVKNTDTGTIAECDVRIVAEDEAPIAIGKASVQLSTAAARSRRPQPRDFQ